jgi:acyl carrier protein
MELEQFVQKFAEQFEETDTTAFGPETIFRNNDEWSSLTSMSIIAMADEEYGIVLTGDDIRSSKTISDVYDEIGN